MAYGFGATLGTGTTDRIQTATSRAWPTLVTISVWTYRNGAGGANFGTIMQHSGAIHYLRNNEGSTVMQFNVVWVTNTGTWTFPRPSTGVWSHICVAYDGSLTTNTPVCYLDGVSQTVTNTSPPQGSINATAGTFGLGNRASDNAVVWDGMLAEWAMWNRVLTADEAVALSRGYSPRFFYGLIEYQPLIRGTGSPIVVPATTNGTPLVQPHPRVIYPERAKSSTTHVIPVGVMQATRPPWRGSWRGMNRGTR